MDSYTCLPNLKKVYIEALTRFSPMNHAGIFNTTSLFQGCVLGAASGIRKDKQNPHSKDRGEGVRSLQVLGQLTYLQAVMSFQ